MKWSESDTAQICVCRPTIDRVMSGGNLPPPWSGIMKSHNNYTHKKTKVYEFYLYQFKKSHIILNSSYLDLGNT